MRHLFLLVAAAGVLLATLAAIELMIAFKPPETAKPPADEAVQALDPAAERGLAFRNAVYMNLLRIDYRGIESEPPAER